MKIAECKLESVSPYSQNRRVRAERLPKELDQAYEERTWRERCNATEKGYVFIPPMAFANSLKEAARYLSISVPGKGKATFTKHFVAGVLVPDPLVLPIMKDEVKGEVFEVCRGEWVDVPANGQRGYGKRVSKCFPLILQWSGAVTYYILDDIITENVFRQVLDAAGSMIGIGRFRPTAQGYYGRYKATAVTWVEN